MSETCRERSEALSASAKLTARFMKPIAATLARPGRTATDWGAESRPTAAMPMNAEEKARWRLSIGGPTSLKSSCPPNATKTQAKCCEMGCV